MSAKTLHGPLCDECRERTWSAISVASGLYRCMRCFVNYYLRTRG